MVAQDRNIEHVLTWKNGTPHDGAVDQIASAEYDALVFAFAPETRLGSGDDRIELRVGNGRRIHAPLLNVRDTISRSKFGCARGGRQPTAGPSAPA